MLEILRTSNPDDKRRHIVDFDPRQSTWVVSDLQSKWHLQSTLLDRHGVLEQSSILRATELWKHLAFQVDPSLRLLSPELAQTLFWNWIEPLGLSWARSPQVVPAVLRQMQMWISVFAAPDHKELMAAWFKDNPESYVRWGTWFELCSELWNRCEEQRWMMMNWLPGFLLAQDLSDLHWDKNLIFDLGPQISLVEGQLIKELGRRFDVQVIYPEAPWIGLMPSPLKPYEDLLPTPYRGNPDWAPSPKTHLRFGRFATQLAEVKDTVARVRGWLESGVKPASIAVVAPDIEEYWPVLRLYFADEGIPVAKSVNEKIGAFTEMSHWTATLRTRLYRISATDLETHFFSQSSPPLSFDEFRVLFTHVYDASDMKRASHLFQEPDLISSSTPLGLEDFVAWSLASWPSRANDERLKSLLQVLAQEVPSGLELKASEWLSYVEGLLARRELKIQEGAVDGVACVSLASTGWQPATHAVFLNLSEGALRAVENSPVSAREVQKILQDTGYSLGATDRQELEFEFLWFLQRDWKELCLNFSVADFSGQVLTPSRFWVWAGFINGELKHKPDAPLATRWDEIQHLDWTEWSKLCVTDAAALREGLDRDQDARLSSWKPRTEERFSASSLERYFDCPFIFAAHRRLKLSDDPVLDLDLDHRTRGRLLHAILDRLGAEPFRADWSDEELGELIESIRLENGILLGDERLWPAMRAQHLRLAKMFLQFEKEWRKEFPNTRTVGRETAFEGHWDLDLGAPKSGPGPIAFSGRLDRVDADAQGRYALIDYKAGSGGLTNWKSWLGNHSLQMPLYAMLLENGLAGLPAGEVMAACFYIVKDLERKKGFYLRDDSTELYASAEARRNWITSEEKQELFIELSQKINEALKKILSGELNPQPIDYKTCDSCHWRGLCRAPHLN